MNEWDLMTVMANASNTGDQKGLSALIVANDLSGKPQATTLALSAFEITKENVSEHMEAAKKLASLAEPAAFRESLRQSVLVEMLNELELA